MNDDHNHEKIQKPKRSYLKSEFAKMGEVALQCGLLLQKTIDAMSTNKLNEEAKKLHDMETEGDLIRDRLLKSFSIDKHPPSLQLDRIELLNNIETVINKCEHAGYEIELAGKYFPETLLPDLKLIMEKVLKTINSVSNGVHVIFESFNEASDIVKDVEDIRDEIRSLVYALKRKALDNSSYNHQNLYAVDQISTQVSSVAEKTKNVATLLQKMKLKYL
jgi:predicted phosphate transport protein (TIGR00153 family)